MKLRPKKKLCLLCASLAILLLYLLSASTDVLHNHMNPLLAVDRNLTEEEIESLENGWTAQEAPRLLQWLQTHWLHPPSGGPLLLDNPHKVYYSQFNQSAMVDKLLHQRSDGFYVECGAGDGEFYSNSLFFERRRHWKGLLIEANPSEFRKLVQKQRHSYSINACLNTVNTTGRHTFSMQHDPGHGGLLHEMKDSHRKQLKDPRQAITVQCFTLYSIMRALGRRRIDFFSLDVEGAELGVLKTIPFQKLDIDVFLIEYLVIGSVKETARRSAEVREFLEGRGYRCVIKTKVDLLFIKKEVN